MPNSGTPKFHFYEFTCKKSIFKELFTHILLKLRLEYHYSYRVLKKCNSYAQNRDFDNSGSILCKSDETFAQNWDSQISVPGIQLSNPGLNPEEKGTRIDRGIDTTMLLIHNFIRFTKSMTVSLTSSCPNIVSQQSFPNFSLISGSIVGGGSVAESEGGRGGNIYLLSFIDQSNS